MDLLKLLNWRYATKRMTGATIPEDKINNILESIRLTVSSIGLQPYRVIVVEDKALREQIRAVSNNQAQITESSHLLIFAALENITKEHVNEYLTNTSVTRNVSMESLSTLKAYLDNITARPKEQNFEWAARQAYIALGTGVIAAAANEVDSCPMEGFNNEALDQLLGLHEQGLRSVAVLALGYRDEKNDWNVRLPKVRLPKEKLFIKKSLNAEVV